MWGSLRLTLAINIFTVYGANAVFNVLELYVYINNTIYVLILSHKVYAGHCVKLISILLNRTIAWHSSVLYKKITNTSSICSSEPERL